MVNSAGLYLRFLKELSRAPQTGRLSTGPQGNGVWGVFVKLSHTGSVLEYFSQRKSEAWCGGRMAGTEGGIEENGCKKRREAEEGRKVERIKKERTR